MTFTEGKKNLTCYTSKDHFQFLRSHNLGGIHVSQFVKLATANFAYPRRAREGYVLNIGLRHLNACLKFTWDI